MSDGWGIRLPPARTIARKKIVIYDYVSLGVIGREKTYQVPSKCQERRSKMKNRVEEFCKRCGHIDGPLKIYRDPFGEATAPGRWPTLTMHSDCFLAYLGERRPIELSSASG
jgi:hypothetical protein